jgi:Leucine-rich repeat (LRR) protein
LERLAAIELQQKQEALENLRKEEAKIADLKRQEQELQKLKMKMEKERLLMAMEDLVSFKIREERMKMDYENKQMAEEELLSVMLQHMIPHKKDKSEGLSVTCKDTYDERNEFDSVVRIEEDLNDYSSFIISVEDDDDMNDANPYVWDPIPFIRRNQYEGQSSTVYPKEADNQKHYTRHLMNQYELEGIHREYINKNMENIRMQYQFQSSQSAIVQVNQSKPSRVSYDLLSCLHSWLHWKSEHHIIIQQQESQSIKLLNDISLDKSNISIISNESLEGSEIKLLKDVGLYGSNTITTTRIELNVENLKSISFLKSFHNLLQLEINVNNLITLVGLEPMIQLEELSVKDNALYSIESLRNHMRLKHLKFDSNKLTDLSPLDGIHSLLTLSASTNLLESIPEIRCERLERLELYHNHIFIICDQSFQGLKNLTYLDLGRNKIEYVSGDGLNSCQLLQTIILSQNKLTRLPTPLYLPHLRNLWLGGNQLNDLNDWIHYLTTPSTADDSIKELMPIFLPSLEKLYLQDNHIQHIPENFLMAMPQLMYFDISFNRIQSIGDLKGLCIGSHGSLQSLLLQDNPLTSIPQLPSLPEHQESVINVEQRAAAFYNNEILELWLRYACPKLKSYCGNHFSTDMNETIPACPESSVSSTEVTSTNNFLSMNINQSQKSSDAHTNHIKEHTKDSLRYYKATGRWKQPTDMALKKATTHLTYDEMLYRIRSASSALIYALSSCPSSASPSPTGIAQHILLYLQKNHDRIHSHSIQSSPLVLELLHQFKNMIMEQNAMRYEEKKFKSNETVQYDDVSNAESFRNLLIQQSERLERWTSHHYDACTRALMHHYIYSKRLRQERNDDKNIITMNPGHINDMNQLYWDDKIIRIQRSYRGYRIRKKIKYLFDSIRYVDDELDDILDMNHTVGDDHYDQLDLDFNLAEYDDYFKPITLDEKYSSSLREATSAIAASVIQPVGTIAYGDHKRLYRRPSSSQLKENSIMYDDDKSIQSETLPSTLPLSSLPHNSKDNILLSNPIPAWDSARHDYHQDSDHKVHQNLSRQTSSSSRPLTSVTITSDITMSSQGSRGSDIPHSYEYQSYQQSHDHNNDDISIADSKLSTDSTQKKASKLSSIANEWGISDPKLMNAILKRNRRLK